MEDDVTAYALEALAAGGGPAAAAVAQALSSATAAGDVFGQARALVALAAVCATPGARDAVEAGAVEAAVDALDSAPAHALQCLADCVRSCPAAATKATRPHVLHAVLRTAERCAGDISIAYAATTFLAAIVAEEHVAATAVPLVVGEGGLILLHDALECASEASDVKLGIAALRAAADIATQCNNGIPGSASIRLQMRDIGLIAAAQDVFSNLFASVLIRDAALAYFTAVCHGSDECAAHFGELNGGNGIRLVLSAARRVGRPASAPPSTTSPEPAVSPSALMSGHPSLTGDIPAPQCPVEPAVPREKSTELHRKTADALAQITTVERNCGVIRSLRGVSTIVSLVAHVAHSARHVEAALISLDRVVKNSQFAARDAYHAAASSVIVVAMQRHRHRGSVQACAIRCLIALTELYDCHRQAACRASAVQATYFALTEHGRSADIVNLACTFLLLLSPCDILSNQICMNDLLRVVVMRRDTNSASTEVQNSATSLVEAIQFIPGDILRKVEAQVVAQPTVGGAGVRSSGNLASLTAAASGASGSLSALGSSESSLRKSWRRRQTGSSLRTNNRAFGRVGAARLSFPGMGRAETESALGSKSSSRVHTARGAGELHRQADDDLLAGVEQGPEAFLMRQTLGRTLESARKPDADFDDGLSLDEAGLEETLATTAALLPDLTGGGLGSTGAIGTVGPTPIPEPIPTTTATHVGSSASSEPASPPWTQWPVAAAMSNEGTESDRALSPLPTLADLPRPMLQRLDLGRGSSTDQSSLVSLDGGRSHLQPYHVMVASGMPPTLSRGETGSL